MTAVLTPGRTTPTVYPTIGVDAGQRWVGITVRVDGTCVDAWTLRRPAVDEHNDEARYAADQQAAGRALEAVHALMDRYHQVGADAAGRWVVEWQVTPWRVAVEGVNTTQPYHRGRDGVARRVPYRTHLLWGMLQTTVVYAAVIGHFPGAVIVSPKERRRQQSEDVPRELTGFRPRRFGPNEHPKRDRMHERDAYWLAGAAQRVRPLRPREA